MQDDLDIMQVCSQWVSHVLTSQHDTATTCATAASRQMEQERALAARHDTLSHQPEHPRHSRGVGLHCVVVDHTSGPKSKVNEMEKSKLNDKILPNLIKY